MVVNQSQIEKVVITIYKYNKENTPICFSMLQEQLPNLTRSEIGKSVDKLFDICMIDAKWENIEGKWLRCLYTSHAYESYLKSLFNSVTEC